MRYNRCPDLMPELPGFSLDAKRRALRWGWRAVLLGMSDPETLYLDLWAALEPEGDPDLDGLCLWAAALIEARRSQLAALSVAGKLPVTGLQLAFAQLAEHQIHAVFTKDLCHGAPTAPEGWLGTLSLRVDEALMETGEGCLFYVPNWPRWFEEEEFNAFGRKRLRKLVAERETEAAQIVGPILAEHGLGFSYHPKNGLWVSGVELVLPLNPTVTAE